MAHQMKAAAGAATATVSSVKGNSSRDNTKSHLSLDRQGNPANLRLIIDVANENAQSSLKTFGAEFAASLSVLLSKTGVKAIMAASGATVAELQKALESLNTKDAKAVEISLRWLCVSLLREMSKLNARPIWRLGSSFLDLIFKYYPQSLERSLKISFDNAIANLKSLTFLNDLFHANTSSETVADIEIKYKTYLFRLEFITNCNSLQQIYSNSTSLLTLSLDAAVKMLTMSTEPNLKDIGNPTAFSRAVDVCMCAYRPILSLLHKCGFKNSVQAQDAISKAVMNSGGNDVDIGKFVDLVVSFLNVSRLILSCDIKNQDLLTNAANAAMDAVRVLSCGDVVACRSASLALNIPKLTMPSTSVGDQNNDITYSNHLTKFIMDKSPCVIDILSPENSRYVILALCRSLLQSWTLADLVAPLLSVENPENPATTVLLHITFDRLYDAAEGSDGELCTFAFEILTLWIEKLHLYVKDQPSSSFDSPSLNRVGLNLAKLLDVIWANWDHPWSSVYTMSRDIFRIACECIVCYIGHLNARPDLVNDEETIVLDWVSIVTRVLEEDLSKKYRFAAISILINILGAKKILQIHPDLVLDCIHASSHFTVSREVPVTMETLLLTAKNEEMAAPSDILLDPNEVVIKIREIWLTPIIDAALSVEPLVRYGLVTFIYPVVLEFDPSSLSEIVKGIDNGTGLASFLENSSGDSQQRSQMNIAVSACVGVLRSGRRLNLVTSKSLREPNILEGRLESLICMASAGDDDDLRLEALDLALIGLVPSEPVTQFEIKIFKEAFMYNIKCSSAIFRQKFNRIVRDFLVRCKVSTRVHYSKLKHASKKKDAATTGKSTTNVPSLSEFISSLMEWIFVKLLMCMYPGSPHERLSTALEIYDSFIEVWCPVKEELNRGKIWWDPILPLLPKTERTCFVGKPEDHLFSPAATFILLNCVINNWDHLRLAAVELLFQFPVPLPGFQTVEQINPLVSTALRLIASMRLRETDAGARLLSVIFDNLILKSLYSFRVGEISRGSAEGDEGSCPVAFTITKGAAIPKGDPDATHVGSAKAALVFVRSLSSMLKQYNLRSRTSVMEAIDGLPAHSSLLSLRYVFERINFNFMSSNTQLAHDLAKCVLDILAELELIAAVSGAVIGDVDLSIEADKISGLSLVSRRDAIIKSQVGGDLSQAGADCRGHPLVENPSEGEDESKLVVSAWLAVKELSLFLGTLIQRVRLPTKEIDEMSAVSVKDVDRIGKLLLNILLSTRHNGAVEKSGLGFFFVCRRLFASNIPLLRDLVASWMDLLLGAVSNSKLTILRRSAGFPSAFLYILRAELAGTSCVLFKKCFNQFFQIIENSYLNLRSSANESGSGNDSASDVWVPTCHCLNILRVIFQEADLRNNVREFTAQSLILAIKGFAHPTFGVRNSSMIAYAAILRRSVGDGPVMSSSDEEPNDNGLSSETFFQRYPAMHQFIKEEFRCIDEEGGTLAYDSKGIPFAGSVHPRLQPILLLFSKLSSPFSSNLDNPLSPSHFISSVSACASQKSFAGRSMAARALLSLISVEQVCAHVRKISKILPTNTPSFCDSLKSKHLTHNSIHGYLLQLHYIMKSKRHIITHVDIADEFVGVFLIVTSIPLLFLSSAVVKCHVIRSLAISILTSILSLSSTDDVKTRLSPRLVECVEEIRSALSETCWHGLGVGGGLGDGVYVMSDVDETAADPVATLGMVEFMEKTSEAYIDNNILHTKSVTVENLQFLSYCINHPLQDLRLCALKALGSLTQGSVNASVLSAVMDNIRVEPQNRCVVRRLKIAASFQYDFNLKNESWVVFLKDQRPNGTGDWWPLLNRLLISSPNTFVKNECFIAMATYLFFSYKIIGGSDNPPPERVQLSGEIFEMYVKEWCDHLTLFSSSSQSIQSRMAVVQAIRAMHCLGWTTFMAPGIFEQHLQSLCLNSWLTIVELLQDDDPDVRREAANVVFEDAKSISQIQGGAVGLKVLIHSLTHITNLFYSSDVLHQYLRNKLESLGAFESVIRACRESSHVIFQVERENAYTEDLLGVQLWCDATQNFIKNRLRGKEAASSNIIFGMELKDALKRAYRCVRSLMELSTVEIPDCFGGISFHRSVYIACYAALALPSVYIMAFHSCFPDSCTYLSVDSSSISIDEGVSVKLLRSISDLLDAPALLNPLLSSLLRCYSLKGDSRSTSCTLRFGEMDARLVAGPLAVWRHFQMPFLLN